MQAVRRRERRVVRAVVVVEGMLPGWMSEEMVFFVVARYSAGDFGGCDGGV